MKRSKIVNPVSAIAMGLKNSGTEYISCYPGFHSHDIARELGQAGICINEKTAYQMCYGANLAGKKSVLTIKGVGLNVCADEYFHSLLSGVNGGIVIILTEDTEVTASQEWQDSRYYTLFYGGLWFEPCSLKEAYQIASHSHAWSKAFDVPIVIRLTSEYFKLQELEIDDTQTKSNYKSRSIKKNSSKYIVYPNNWLNQQLNLCKKNQMIQDFVELYLSQQHNRLDDSSGLIEVTAGVRRNRDLKNGHYRNTIEVSTYPLPQKTLAKLIGGYNEVRVSENGRRYVNSQVELIKKGIYTNFEINVDLVRNLNPIKTRFIVWNHLEKLFKAIKASKLKYVVGDVGSYTIESTKSIDSCLCLGSSVGICAGLADSGIDYPLCVVGDTGFVHGGITGLYEALAKNVSMGIVVIDNGGSWSTGGQKVHLDIYSFANKKTKITLNYSKVSEDEIKLALANMQKMKGVSILFIKVKQGKLSL